MPFMLDSLITSKTRVKLLMKFFLNPETRAHLRGLEEEFGESTNGIRIELNRLEEAKMLESEFEGQKKIFKVSTKHPLYSDINNIVKKYLGIDQLVNKVVEGLGGVEEVYLVGKLANGQEDNQLEIALLGDINTDYLKQLIEKAQDLVSKKISYRLIENQQELNQEPHILLWRK